MNDAELRAALREHAYLEGDFVLRSGRRSRYYLDKYRFETRPDLLRPLGERLAEAIREHEPEAELIARGRSSAPSRSRRLRRSSRACPS
jgi:orotate phosphoribosyltransferase